MVSLHGHPARRRGQVADRHGGGCGQAPHVGPVLHVPSGGLPPRTFAACCHQRSRLRCALLPLLLLLYWPLPLLKSGDYQNPAGNLEPYGAAAVFFAAVGIAPSKDNWWSTAAQPRPRDLTRADPTALPPCDGGSRNVTRNFLHALVATPPRGREVQELFLDPKRYSLYNHSL
jgi:hypothetical protein